MTVDVSYEKKISRFKRSGLLNLWNSIVADDTPEWEAGKAFEYLIPRAFELEGAEVRWPYRVNIAGEEIEQIDGVVYSSGLACLIECKDTAMKVDAAPIAKMRNQLLRRPATTHGIIFSRSGFTDSAIALAGFVAPQTIILWQGEEIAYALKRKFMRQVLATKYRYCIEHGVQFYNITGEKLP